MYLIHCSLSFSSHSLYQLHKLHLFYQIFKFYSNCKHILGYFILYLIFVPFWRVKAYSLNYRGWPVIKKIPLAAVQCGSPSKSCSGSWDWVHKVQRTATRCVPATLVGTHGYLYLATCEKAGRLTPLLLQLKRVYLILCLLTLTHDRANALPVKECFLY